jgi:hypothetical protein
MKNRRNFGKRKSDYVIRYLLIASILVLIVEGVVLLVQNLV